LHREWLTLVPDAWAEGRAYPADDPALRERVISARMERMTLQDSDKGQPPSLQNPVPAEGMAGIG